MNPLMFLISLSISLPAMLGAKVGDAIKVSKPFLEKGIVDDIIFGGVAGNIFLWDL